MGQYKLRMPDVGEGVVEAEIVAWHVKVGDTVQEDEDLCDVMTDKATVEIPSPVTGRVVSLVGAAGDVIPVGTEIIVIETDADITAADDAPAPEAKQDAPTAPAPSPAPTPSPKPSTSSPAPAVTASANATASPAFANGQRPLASPAVRQRALELDVALSNVPGSGPAGRISHQDLDDFIAAGGRISARGTGGSTRTPMTGVRETKIIGLRRKIAENMSRTWATVPHITYVEEIDVTEVEALRKTLNAGKTTEQPKLTLIPFLATALIKALRDVPEANAHYDSEAGTLTEFDGVHLGIAAATDKGLMVPVLRHAEAMDVWQRAGEVNRLAQAARDGTAKRDELSGSSITITSLGAIGGVVTTPIINAPETAIIGVNKIQERPVFDGAGRVVPRLFMNLSSSFDHRIVDGYDAAILVQAIRRYLETPAMLFMD